MSEKKKSKPGVLLECGLWERESSKGTKYYSTLTEIAGSEYWVNIFKNKSDNPKAPTLNLLITKADASTKGNKSKSTDKDDIPF